MAGRHRVDDERRLVVAERRPRQRGPLGEPTPQLGGRVGDRLVDGADRLAGGVGRAEQVLPVLEDEGDLGLQRRNKKS